MGSAGMDEAPIESKLVSRSIQSAQTQVEAQNFEIRKNVLKYDDVLNRQRQVIYENRRRVLEGEDVHEQMRYFVNDVINGYVDAEATEGFSDEWDLDRLWTAMKTLYPISLSKEEVVKAAGGINALNADVLREELLSDAHRAYDQREEQLGSEVMREVERRVLLSVLDRKWREHLYEMDYLQEGIGLRAMAQRDPLVEYQREGFQLWEAMNESVKEEAVGLVFHVEVELDNEPAPAPAPVHVSEMFGGLADTTAGGPDGHVGEEEPGEVQAAAEEAVPEPLPVTVPDDEVAPAAAGARPHIKAPGLDRPSRPQQLHYTAPSDDGGVEERDVVGGREVSAEEFAGTPRNAPCPCGSGKKYKMCHGR
jgi:preprotein translocase subunit SecA